MLIHVKVLVKGAYEALSVKVLQCIFNHFMGKVCLLYYTAVHFLRRHRTASARTWPTSSSAIREPAGQLRGNLLCKQYSKRWSSFSLYRKQTSLNFFISQLKFMS